MHFIHNHWRPLTAVLAAATVLAGLVTATPVPDPASAVDPAAVPRAILANWGYTGKVIVKDDACAPHVDALACATVGGNRIWLRPSRMDLDDVHVLAHELGHIVTDPDEAEWLEANAGETGWTAEESIQTVADCLVPYLAAVADPGCSPLQLDISRHVYENIPLSQDLIEQYRGLNIDEAARLIQMSPVHTPVIEITSQRNARTGIYLAPGELPSQVLKKLPAALITPAIRDWILTDTTLFDVGVQDSLRPLLAPSTDAGKLEAVESCVVYRVVMWIGSGVAGYRGVSADGCNLTGKVRIAASMIVTGACAIADFKAIPEHAFATGSRDDGCAAKWATPVQVMG